MMLLPLLAVLLWWAVDFIFAGLEDTHYRPPVAVQIRRLAYRGRHRG